MKSFTPNMKNQLKQLNKAYCKRLNKVDGLEYFIEYLKYLRDYSIINVESAEVLKASSKVTALIVTISEFEAYRDSTEEKQRKFHWINFWELVKLNMEEWQVLNDSV
jgi:hypothetical protein